MRPGYLLLLLLIIAKLGFSQQPNYYFKNYQVSNGLSSNTITAITQDKKGFMWFGTRNGLNRFDGNVFKVFRNKTADSTSIGSNSILSLYEDKEEQLWVGTYKGIYIYNPLKESFRPFNLIPAGEVRFIQADKYHNIWILSRQVLYSYNLITRKLNSHPYKEHQTVSLHVSENGTLWAATVFGTLRKFNAKTNSFTNYDIPTLYKKDLTIINAIYSLGDTSVVLGTIRHALIFNTRTKQFTNLFEHNKAISNVHVHAIFRQSKSSFWLGTEGGLYIANLQTGKTAVVAKELSNPYSINDNIISSIYRDVEGGIWIGTYFGGANYYSNQFNHFRKYFPEPNKNSLSGNLVHEICKGPEDKIWIGTEDAGLNELDLKTGNIRQFMPDNTPSGISYHNIHGLAVDNDKLWIGTYEHGIDVMDLNTKRVIRHYDASPQSFTSDFIICLYKTHSGDILVGTWNGLFKYNRATDDFSPVPFFKNDEHSKFINRTLNGTLNALFTLNKASEEYLPMPFIQKEPSDEVVHIQTIFEDENGTLWIGSYGSGFYCYNPKTNFKQQFEYKQGNTNGLINNYVNNLYQDSKNNIWLCTEGGLSKFTPSTGRFTNYNEDNGLPDGQIFRILEDNAGQFWISTAKGLSRFNPHNQTFSNYHTTHGLPTEQFNYNSSYKNDDGTLFFGTVKGLISFKPSDFTPNRFNPPVYITDIQINNTDVKVNSKDSPLEKSIMYTSKLTLPYYKSNLSFDVAALSYVIPEMNGYMYKLEGLDKQWVILKNNRKIFYTKLAPGNYTFKIKGSSSEGIWNSRETTLDIRIRPPFWATGWAYSLYTLVVFAIVLTIFWYYRLALHEKNKRKIEIIEISKEREIYNAKIEFFTNVAHEIRTPLTLIKMPLDKLLSKQNEDPDTQESLTMMKKNTNRLIDLTNQLLDFRKAEANKFSLNFSKTDINELLSDVFATFKPAAEQKGLNYKLTLPRITLHAYVDTEAFKKIITNLINNAIKYSEGMVIVRLLPFSSDDDMFSIEFRNDGFLVPAEHAEKIFEPFYRMEESKKEAGTGIGLPLSRSLAELHKGTLSLKKTDDSTNLFLLSLPIHQDYEINLKDDSGQEDTSSIPAETDDITKEHDSSKPLILIVEDNKDILTYLYRELSSTYHVLKAINGQEALEILLKDNVQLVISDIMMPVMDGIELCKRIKLDLQYSHIPIILLTAKNSLSSKIEGLEVGADAYIEKPFSFEHLFAQMNSLLKNRNNIKEHFARSPLTHIKGIAYSKADKDFLEKLNNVIYANITDMELDVEQLSSMMNMSRPTLYRKIKGLSDLTPNELINLSRLKKAAELLAEGVYKINEVANMVGYSLPTNFSRDFQKQFGISPSNYVNSLRNA